MRETARTCQFCLHSFDAKRGLWQRLFGRKPEAAPVVIAAVAITTLRGH